MAYTVTGEDSPVIRRIGGRHFYEWAITETDAATGSEFTLEQVPVFGTIVSYEATLTAGTGTTVNPRIGIATGFTDSTQNHVGTNSTTAAHVNDQTILRYYAAGGQLFILNNCDDLTADHSIGTRIMIVEGWDVPS